MTDVTLVTDGPSFPCPNCGATDRWVADYYQAVRQGCTVVTAESGDPAVMDYGGDESAYDDGATDNEAIRCLECDHEIVFARFRLVPAEDVDLDSIRAACGYKEEPDEGADGLLEDLPVDALIDYKNALEDLVGRLLGEPRGPLVQEGRPL